MTSALDYPDFTTSVAVLDQGTIPPGSPFTMAPGDQVFAIDTSRASTLTLALGLTNGVFGDRSLITIFWLSAGQSVDEEVITFHSKTSYGAATSTIYYQVPCRGDSFNLYYQSSGAGNLIVNAALSTRTVDGPRFTRFGTNRGRLLLDANFGSIAAGGSSGTVYVPPVAEKFLLRINQKIAAVQLVVDAVTDIGAIPQVTRAGLIFGTDVTNQGVPFYLPNTGLQLRMDNNDTVAHASTLEVLDVS